MKFAELPLTDSILKSLERMNYAAATDVQARTIPLVLAGKDVLVTAQTGTGKTAAFAVPLMQKMVEALESDAVVPRALVLCPTRELAEQIGGVLRELTFFYRRMRYAVVIGGAPYPKQFRELGMNPAFVVGTPGRIIDHIETGTLKLDEFQFLVLDESDRMLDMGFSPQIEMILKRFPSARQTMMFSATLPAEVRGLVAKYLSTPSRVAIGEENKPVAAIKQDVIELYDGDKEERLLHEIDGLAGSMIVFCKTRLRADLVASSLQEAGHEAAALHGELTQSMRRRVTASFRDGSLRILVATDIAARGLDIDHVRHVFNFDLPMLPEDYVHRIGRTGRNGAEGHSVAFVTPQEKHRWGQIQKLMRGGGSAGASGARGYRGAVGRGAFSGGGSDRSKPFTSSYIGPTEKDIRANAEAAKKAKHGGAGYVSEEARKVRETFQSRVEKAEERKARKLGRTPRFSSETNTRSGGPAKRHGGGAGRAGGSGAVAGRGGAGAAAGANRSERRAASAARTNDAHNSAHRTARLSARDEARGASARGPKTYGPNDRRSAQATPSGKKPHKGKPDTRKRKSIARSPHR